jgi:hypothetical protein
MYDFNTSLPKSREDLKEWLIKCLRPSNDEKEYTIKDEIYMNEFSFRKSSFIHSVFRNVKTKEYVWYVIPDICVDDFEHFPKKRYASYESLIDSVVEYYYKLSKLNG